MTKPVERTIIAPIQAGQLTITIQREELPLEECLTFATRQNPQRLYLLVSKVLGKHWPVRPTVMRDIHCRLAAKIADLPGPLLVIGLAETATALGRGVAEEAAALTGRDDILYLQTTRYRLNRLLAFGFDESHSHAPDHAVYLPDSVLQPLFRAARSLILVDDEISTGRTLAELAKAYLAINPDVEQIAFACITNWLNPAYCNALTLRLERPLLFPALIEGSFRFEPNALFTPPILPIVIAAADRYHDHLVADPARIGLIAGCYRHDDFANPCSFLEKITGKRAEQPLTIIGTGEYTYSPFRIALALEEAGHDVVFQSTTRSPILVGDAIISRREFADNYGDGIPNYLYNFDSSRWPIVIYEHPNMLETHALVNDLTNDLAGSALCGETSCHAS